MTKWKLSVVTVTVNVAGRQKTSESYTLALNALEIFV